MNTKFLSTVFAAASFTSFTSFAASAASTDYDNIFGGIGSFVSVGTIHGMQYAIQTPDAPLTPANVSPFIIESTISDKGRILSFVDSRYTVQCSADGVPVNDTMQAYGDYTNVSAEGFAGEADEVNGPTKIDVRPYTILSQAARYACMHRTHPQAAKMYAASLKANADAQNTAETYDQKQDDEGSAAREETDRDDTVRDYAVRHPVANQHRPK